MNFDWKSGVWLVFEMLESQGPSTNEFVNEEVGQSDFPNKTYKKKLQELPVKKAQPRFYLMSNVR